MTDITIICQDCGQEFAWTEDEREYYQKNNLPKPVRCPICRATFEAAQRDKFRGKRK